MSPQGSGLWTLSLPTSSPAPFPQCHIELSEDISLQDAFWGHLCLDRAQCFTQINALLMVEFPVAVARPPVGRYSNMRGGFWSLQNPPYQKAAVAGSFSQGKKEAADRG